LNELRGGVAYSEFFTSFSEKEYKEFELIYKSIDNIDHPTLLN